jgi:RNA polymerase sigma-70 factor (ECF subfamily)
MSIDQLHDAELVKLYVSGNESSLEVLIRRHQKQVFSFIFKNVKDRTLAEDIFQDCFIRVIKTLKTEGYSEEGKFLPWVMRIARNLVNDHFRGAHRFKPAGNTSEDYDFFERNILENADEQEPAMKLAQQRDIRRMIHRLPQDVKTVVIMRTFLDLSFKEIADITQVPINTALGRMRNGVLKLRKMIEEKERLKELTGIDNMVRNSSF